MDPDFKELWDRISKRTKYRVSLSTDDLVSSAALGIARRRPDRAAEGSGSSCRAGAQCGGDRSRTSRSINTSTTTAAPTVLPDILADLQNETDLTRATLVRILRESGRLSDFTVNPQAFTVMVTAKINAVAA